MRLYSDDERGATSPLSKAEFARLVAANPNATDEEILRTAVGGSEPSLASKIFEQPILPELDIENPLGQGAYNVLRNIVVGSPADLALNVATLGAATAPRLGLKAAAPALRAASGALSGAFGARGISHALDEDADPATRTFGVIQGLLGGAGAAGELRALSRAGKVAPALPRPESIPADIARPELGTVARRVRQMEGTSDPQFHMLEDTGTFIQPPAKTSLANLKSLALTGKGKESLELRFDRPVSRGELEPFIQELAGPDARASFAGFGSPDNTDHYLVMFMGDRTVVPGRAREVAQKLGGATLADGQSVDERIASLAMELGHGYRSPARRLDLQKELDALKRERATQGKLGAGGTTALSLAGPVASQFISEEDDPDGIIRTGLNLMGLGGLGAAAYWQMKPATKLSTLAAGQAATGKSFDDFKALAPTYVPEGFTEKQLERAWAFGIRKADELHLAHPRAFDEDYWSSLYDKDPSFQNWWEDALDVAKEVAPENPELFALFLGVTSAQAAPKQNFQRALQAWDAYQKGAPFPSALGRTQIKNLNRAVSEGRIGGRKTSSMAETVLGREEDGPILPRAVLDRHMAKLSGFGDHRKEAVLNDPEYEILERILERVAQKKGIRISQLQAGLWKHGLELSDSAAVEARGRMWEKPDVSYPFGQIKRLLEAEAKVTPTQTKQFVATAKGMVRDTVANGGSTYDPRTGKVYSGGGFAVGMFPEPGRHLEVPVASLSDSVILGYIRDNLDLLQDKRLMVGSWLNKNTGNVELDIVVPVKDRHHAEWLAGPKRYNQIAVFDLNSFEEIPTGGTGKGRGPNAPADIYDRLGDLDTIDIEHYTRKPGVSVLDPEFYGTGMAGEESRRKDLPNWVNRVYAYAAGTRPEARFRGASKITGRIPKRAIYDLNEDPLKLREKIDLASGPQGLNALEKAVMEAGFMGMEFPAYPGYLQFFTKIYMDDPVLTNLQDAPALMGRSFWQKDQDRFYRRLNLHLRKALEKGDVEAMRAVHDRLMKHLEASGQPTEDALDLIFQIRAAVSHIAPNSPQARYMKALAPVGARRVAGGNIGSTKG